MSVEKKECLFDGKCDIEGSMDNPHFRSPGGPSRTIQDFKAQDMLEKYHGGHLPCLSTQCNPKEQRKYVQIVTRYVTLLHMKAYVIFLAVIFSPIVSLFGTVLYLEW
jgi:hypothetical protein